MKLAPVNGINVCELLFVLDMDVFSICFNFLTIFQVDGLHYVLITNNCLLLTVLKSLVA